MKEEQARLNEQLIPDVGINQVFVRDIVQYLSALAQLSDQEKTGNLELSQALRDLTNSLRPFSHHPVAELSSFLRPPASTNGIRKRPARDKATLPTELEDIGQDDVEQILEDSRYTKIQVAELGFRRFGISRAKLIQLSKKDAIESVRAALGHEKSLDAISEEARKSGIARTS